MQGGAAMKGLLKLGALFGLWFCVGFVANATTHYARPDGGTLYTANVPTGQCDGEADVAYPGTGTDQHCAVNDFRYAWDDNSGVVGSGNWALSNTVAGDTWVIRGCTALAGQMNPSNPNCRIGWDKSTGSGPDSNWCYGVGSFTCYNPQIPNNVTIEGGCVTTSSCNPVVGYPYTSNLTQLFCGFSLSSCINLTGSSGVTIKGIELTTHNQHWNGSAWSGNCTIGTGSPAYPVGCANSQPLDDYAQNGFLTSATTTNLTLVDVYVHGFDSAGFFGPIGAGISLTRVQSDFNAFAGWNFDDGSDDPDGTGATIAASYVRMEGNGFYEQYPIVNTAFPARAGYDPNSSGFGDAWSGQDTTLTSFSCDHCVMLYNTKDAFIGPHTQIGSLSVTNSVSYGNMGAQWKWGQAPNGMILFQNNLTVCNPYRQQTALPGAAQNFNISTSLGGSYLSDYGRGNACFANLQRSGSVNHFYGNTVIGAQSIAFQLQCGYYSTGNVFNQETNCGSVPNLFKDGNFLSYTDPNVGEATALYYALDAYSIFTGSYNNEFGWKSGTTDTCGSSGNICVDPLLVSEPAQTWPGSEAALDVFNPFVSGNSFYPTSGSPLIGAGTAISGLAADYYGTTRPSPPSLGGVEYVTPSGTPGVGITGTVTIGGSVVIQ
jgi:hypothetical protein